MRSAGMTGSSILVLAMAIASLSTVVPTPAVAGHQPTTLQVVGALHGGNQQVELTSYSLRKLRDLRIVAWWNVRGSHVQRLEIRAPDGSLYQRLTQPFKMGSHLHVGGDPRGTPVRTVV